MHGMRIGCGIDLHRLYSDPGRPLMLGGVEIPGDLALEGHSDADCILHALTDAILGALALGDIGEYFPNTDPQWKNVPSERFLERAVAEMRLRHYTIANVDIVVLAEVPKLSPHKPAIRAKLAELLNVQPDQVGLKATTLEKLGALGRGEGILAQAVVLLAPAPPPPLLTKPAGVQLSLEPSPEPPEAVVPAAKLREVVARDLASKPAPARKATKASKAPAKTAGAVDGTPGKRVLRVWTDGASRGNPGHASIGVVLKDEAGNVLHEGKLYLGQATNNVAEYRALIYGLQVAIPFDPDRLEVYADSELMIKQMRGEYRVKNPELEKLYYQAQLAARELREVKYTHVRRELNKEADALANQALDEHLDD